MLCIKCKVPCSDKTGVRLPLRRNILQQWLQAMELNISVEEVLQKPRGHFYVCFDHFSETDKIIQNNQVVGIRDGAIPANIEGTRLKEELEKVPDFVLVEKSKLEMLLHYCFDCGHVIGKTLDYTITGTGITYNFWCSQCNTQKWWHGQEPFEYGMGRRQTIGNLKVAAAAILSPLSYEELSSFFDLVGIAGLSMTSFYRISKGFAWPEVSNYYQAQEESFFKEVKKGQGEANFSGLTISCDGQYDSPGFSSAACNVTCMDNLTNKVLCFESVYKEETEQISNRMELLATKRVLERVIDKEKIPIIEMITDRHTGIKAYMSKERPYIKHKNDFWHFYKSISSKTREEAKKKKHSDLKEIRSHFLNHLYYSVENSDGNPQLAKELALSSIMHFLNIHSWNLGNIAQIMDQAIRNLATQTGVPMAVEFLAIGGLFQNESFKHIEKCLHGSLDPDRERKFLAPNSPSLIVLVEILTSDSFLFEIVKISPGKSTSLIENVNSLAIKYRPKRKFYSKQGFDNRTKLAVMHYNYLVDAEKAGVRQVIAKRKVFSKAKNGKVEKKIKTPILHDWKFDIMKAVIARKMDNSNNDVEEIDDVLDLDVEPDEDVLCINLMALR